MPEAGHEADARARRLTAAMARGDRAALGEFYELRFDWAFTLARSLTARDESFCLDVVQDAMLRIVRSVRPMRSERDLDRWLNRVVHTAALDLLRRESRRVAREARRADHRQESVALRAEIADRIEWVRARLAELPSADRWLVWLRLGRGVTLEEAGRAAGVTGDAAHGRIRRSIARLRAAGENPDE